MKVVEAANGLYGPQVHQGSRLHRRTLHPQRSLTTEKQIGLIDTTARWTPAFSFHRRPNVGFTRGRIGSDVVCAEERYDQVFRPLGYARDADRTFESTIRVNTTSGIDGTLR